MRARWYDPSTGESLSVDPDFNQTLDAYGYGDENPLDGSDPSGFMVDTSSGGYGATTCQIAKSVCQISSVAAETSMSYNVAAKLTTKQVKAITTAEAATGTEASAGYTWGQDVDTDYKDEATVTECDKNSSSESCDDADGALAAAIGNSIHADEALIDAENADSSAMAGVRRRLELPPARLRPSRRTRPE
jgi:hypothetical protein